MTTREIDALVAMDFACWENCEEGGQGWVRPASIAALLEVSLCWAYELLSFLIGQNLAERRRFAIAKCWYGPLNVFHYAPTEQGADLLLQLDRDEGEGRDG